MSLLPRAVFLLPDNDFPVIGTGSQDVAIHGVGPGYLPYWPLMSAREGVGMLRGSEDSQCYLPLERQQNVPMVLVFLNQGLTLCTLFSLEFVILPMLGKRYVPPYLNLVCILLSLK